MMNSQRLTNWIQILTGSAVLLGLGLVIWELRQSREVAIAQLTSEGYGIAMGRTISEMGENPGASLVKACEDPASLTSTELVVLNAFHKSLLNEVMRAFRIEQRSGLYEGTWKQIANGGFGGIFQTAAGRVWWEKERQSLPEEVSEVGESILKSEPLHLECWLEDWKSGIEKHLSANESD